MPGRISTTSAEATPKQPGVELLQPAIAQPPKQSANPPKQILSALTTIFARNPATQPPTAAVEPTNIICAHCKQMAGHYTANCPLSCTYCKERGHEAVNCEPRCITCNGSGVIKKQSRLVNPEPLEPTNREWLATAKAMEKVCKDRLIQVEKNYETQSKEYDESKTQLELILGLMRLQRDTIAEEATMQGGGPAGDKVITQLWEV
ncbi:hypothetical protein CC86DRAFT_369187 [Ophiobolus disseminans]|uniref:CCHC-type domain-containing protein n=1 Tax=Ophiobolus disseminans TaxID=1469910 RepID=A0A6A7A3Z4_9PLEO|nr:hypothetical protein CC86DRAFT_369187 [Ophiobolus disseminans]